MPFLLGAGIAQGPAARLVLSNAPITLEYPEEWREWAISLASYADAAAKDISAIIGVPVPAGTIRWEPAAEGPGTGADGVVEVRGSGRSAVVILRTNVPLMLQDFGAAYALGYARWLGAYAVGRAAMGAPGASPPWWTEGAALYLTSRLFRDSSSTTPVLYGIQGNFTRAAQSRRPVDLAAEQLNDAARGKSLMTFNLLEAIYGGDVVGQAIGRLVARPSADLAVIVDAIGSDRDPDPDALLREWLAASVAIDVRLKDVDLRDGGKIVRVRIERETPFPIPVLIEVRGADGGATTATVPAGIDDATVEIEAPGAVASVVADPDGLIPDVNRSNNRHGFGNADNVRRFFAFDNLFEIGELQFGGEVTLDESQQRRERFSLLVTNRTERDTGLGFLVSAEWFDRPERVQRAYFVHLGPGETRLIEESFAYPNRGTGRGRVRARFWNAGSVEDLTDKLVSVEPGAINAYIVVRDAPEAPRRARRGIYRRPPTITETVGTQQERRGDPTSTSASAADATAVTAETVNGETTPAAEGFAISITSPVRGTPPIGEVVLEASIQGTAELPERVEFFVNDRRVGSISDYPYRMRWEFPEREQVFVIRAVAVIGDRLASDDVILDKGAIAFGATVNLVTVHATVRDAQNHLVRGLAAEDFRVVEDGTGQEVVQFDYGEVPVSVAVLLDQSSSMIGSGIRAERAGARRLVDSLVNEVNRAMVMAFNDKVYLYADFTTDIDELHESLEAVHPDGSTALFDTLAESIRKVNRRRGKRALVVLTDGLDTNSEVDYEDVVEYLRQSEVLVYTIGMQLMHEGTQYGDASGAVKRGIGQLRTLAEATGGAAYFPLGLEELEEIYGLIADELNSQYALSYYPANQRFDGTWRELRVTVPGHSDYWIQVRPGYYGVEPKGR